MPTKPVTAPPIWSSNATWTSGPHTGIATKVAPSAGQAQNGHVGGETYKAQFQNYVDNLLTTWVATWLALGTANPDGDAHIVESDATGRVQARRLEVGSGLANLTAINVLQPSGNATGIYSRGGATSGNAIVGESTTTAAAILGFGSLGPGVDGSGLPGVRGTGVGTTGTGVEGQGGSVDGIGVQGTAGGNGTGVRGIGGASGTGVWGSTTDTTNNYGVYGSVGAGATTSVAGVRASGVGDARGLYATSVDGYAAELVTQNNTRAALRITPQDGEPSTPLSGDVYFSDAVVGGLDHDELRIYGRGAWRSVMTERFGYCRAFAVNASTVSHSATGSWTSAVSCNLAAPNEPRRTGTVWIRFRGEVGRAASGGTNNIQVRLFDVTDGSAVSGSTKTVTLLQGPSIFERHFEYEIAYALPAAGARQIDLEITTTVNTEGARIRDASVHVYGVV